MKKHLILLFSVLMAFGFPSCSDDEQEPPVVEPEVVTLSVGTENGYGEELPVTWNEGDQLGVFAAETLNGTFLLSGEGGKVTSDFTGKIMGNLLRIRFIILILPLLFWMEVNYLLKFRNYSIIRQVN